jgi:3-methyladenine DNA glycosylase/8-oxoguanine DNA glycosylase
MTPDASGCWEWPATYDFFETTRLLRTGRGDPTVRREPDGLWRTARLTSGPATVRLHSIPGQRIEAIAWGAGASEAVAKVSRWLGLAEPPMRLPAHPATDRLLRDRPGVRLADTGDLYEALLVFTLQQLVTWNEAAYNWRRLVETFGEPAPGPAGLRLIPSPQRLRQAAPDTLVGLGINRQQARTLREIALSARGVRAAAALPTDEAMRLLQHVPGVGPWTAASALGFRLGRPDPVIVGDASLPHAVAWALAGEPRATDARMIELLGRFPGQAFEVIRLVHAARIDAPRRSHKRRIVFGRH